MPYTRTREFATNTKPLLRVAEKPPAALRNFQFAGVWRKNDSTTRLEANVSLIKESGSTWLCLKDGTAQSLCKPCRSNSNYVLIAERGKKGDSVSLKQVQGAVQESAELLAEKYFAQHLQDNPVDLRIKAVEQYFNSIGEIT